jgi:hypothetical protein
MRPFQPTQSSAGLSGIESYLEQTSRNAFLRFAGLIDHATSGRRGKYATIALNMAGVTSNQQAISDHYAAHNDVIDQYFEHVDVIALAKKLDVDDAAAKGIPRAIGRTGGLLLAGAAIGVAALTLYNRKKLTHDTTSR